MRPATGGMQQRIMLSVWSILKGLYFGYSCGDGFGALRFLCAVV